MIIVSITRIIISCLRFKRKENFKMASLTAGHEFPLTYFISDPLFFCHSIHPIHKYEDGKRVDEIVAYKYRVTSVTSFKEIEITVPQKRPLMEPEELDALQQSGKDLFVEFTNAMLKIYFSFKNHRIEDSIKAEAVKEVKD